MYGEEDRGLLGVKKGGTVQLTFVDRERSDDKSVIIDREREREREGEQQR